MDQNVSKPEDCLSEVPAKKRGEIRTAICEAISSFDQDRTGRGTNEIRGQVIGDLLVVRLVVRLGESLTEAERQLVRSVLVKQDDEKIQLSAAANPHLHTCQECRA